MRFLRAYWVTLVVIGSYLWVRFQASLRGEAWARQELRRKHVINARRIQRAIVRLQGLFIKVGQTFSILTNVLPEEFRSELEGLQDSVPARPFAGIRQRFLDDFGKAPAELFAEFDETPLAAASISQVHRATLNDGTRVAVKIQYPDIDAMVESDLKTFRRILKLVQWFAPTHGLDTVYREVAAMLRAELDFSEEARSILRITENFAGQQHMVAFPTVVEEFTTRHVLTTHFVDGTKVSNTGRLRREGHDTAVIARRLVDIYCKQIFRDGFYHADPHPGNVLVNKDGTVTLLDFGAVASVSQKMRTGIANFLQGILSQDTEKIAEALREMGFIAVGRNEEVFERVVAYFHEKFQESITLESFNLKDIKVDPEMGLEHLLALRKMDIGIGELSTAFKIPREWILLERTLLLLTGLCTHLDPHIRPMELIRPYLREFLIGEDGDLSAFLVDTGKDLALQALALPADLRKFLNRATTGRLEFRSRGAHQNARMLYALGHQLIYTLVGIAAASLAAFMHTHGEAHYRDMACWTAVGAGVFLLGSIWRQSSENRRRRE